MGRMQDDYLDFSEEERNAATKENQETEISYWSVFCARVCLLWNRLSEKQNKTNQNGMKR